MDAIEIMLGHDSDCETCGWSYNEVTFDPDWEDGRWGLVCSVGCYGGDSAYYPDVAGAVEILDWVEEQFNVNLSEIRVHIK